MYKLINPINPFGIGCAPMQEVDEATKEWLIETGKCIEEDFESEEKETKNKSKKQIK